MLTKFLPTLTPMAALAYLDGPQNSHGITRPSKPRVVAGDRIRFNEVATSSRYKWSHLSAALSHGESMAEVGVGRVVGQVHRFVRLITGGLPSSHYVFVAFLHERKLGLDVHVLIGKDDLYAHRSLPLWSATKAEKKLLNVWRRVENLEAGTGDPDDPWRRRHRSPLPRGLSREERDDFREIDQAVTEYAAAGWLQHRTDIVELFEKLGYKTKPTNEHVTAITPDGRHLKFTGAKYSTEFDLGSIARDRSQRGGRNSEEAARELAVLRPKLARLDAERSAEFARRFGTADLARPHPHHVRLARAYGVELDAPQSAEFCGTPSASGLSIRATPKPGSDTPSYDHAARVDRDGARSSPRPGVSVDPSCSMVGRENGAFSVPRPTAIEPGSARSESIAPGPSSDATRGIQSGTRETVLDSRGHLEPGAVRARKPVVVAPPWSNAERSTALLFSRPHHSISSSRTRPTESDAKSSETVDEANENHESTFPIRSTDQLSDLIEQRRKRAAALLGGIGAALSGALAAMHRVAAAGEQIRKCLLAAGELTAAFSDLAHTLDRKAGQLTEPLGGRRTSRAVEHPCFQLAASLRFIAAAIRERATMPIRLTAVDRPEPVQPRERFVDGPDLFL